jgi:hypothetical protein
MNPSHRERAHPELFHRAKPLDLNPANLAGLFFATHFSIVRKMSLINIEAAKRAKH